MKFILLLIVISLCVADRNKWEDHVVTHKVKMTFAADSQIVGDVTIDLYGKTVPQTVKNFRSLCTGEAGFAKKSGKKLDYKGSKIHKILQGYFIEMGDIINGDGSGNESIFGKKFGNENHILKHERGVLTMQNDGDSNAGNGSKFLLLTGQGDWSDSMDGKFVVFGRVSKNYNTIQKIELLGSQDGKTMKKTVVVSDCQVINSDL